LFGPGVAVARRAALEHVGDVDVLAGEAQLREPLVEQLACATDERLALAILVGARGLAHEHHVGLRIAHAEHDADARGAERAALAVAHVVDAQVLELLRGGPALGLFAQRSSAGLLCFIESGVGRGLGCRLGGLGWREEVALARLWSRRRCARGWRRGAG